MGTAITATFLAIVLLAGVASASCENGLEARSRQFSLVYWDTKPAPIGPTHKRKIALMWDRMALALATAARIQRQIEKNRNLRAILSEAPVSLQMSPNGSIEIVSAPDRMTQSLRDSLRSLVSDLKPRQASEVSLYSVKMARSVRGPEKEMLLRKLRTLAERRTEKASQSSLALDWVHKDCNVGDSDRPTLFVVTSRVAGRTTYSIMSGLYVDRRDALHAARQLSAEFQTPARVVPIRLNGPLLKNVFPPV
ncbi:MAG TPA: hypothetical protein VGJ98_01415 [Candidatus Eisenbacteria bacterium]|jgi:hypothetical protein